VAVLGPPQEVWGNHQASLALWTTAAPPQLLYYRAGYVAHALSPPSAGAPTFVHWGPAGDWLAFYEVKRQQAYEVVFVHLPNGPAYRVPASDELLQQLPGLLQDGPRLRAILEQACAGPLVAEAAPAALRPH